MALPARTHLAVLVDPRGERWRLVELTQRWAEQSDLVDAFGVDRAWRCAPARWETQDRAIHLLAAEAGSDLAADGWIAFGVVPDDGPDVEPATLGWLRETYAAWRAGSVGVPGQPWWDSSWPAQVLGWVDAVLPAAGLRRSADPVPSKLWPLSAVLRVPVEGEGGARDLWFKATCDWFRAEPALTALVAGLAPQLAPRVVAVDDERAWILLEELVQADAESPALAVPVAEGLSRLQLAVGAEDLAAAGVPRRPLASLVEDYRDALHHSVVRAEFTDEQWRGWAAVEEWVTARIEELDSLGLPPALNHGDLHLGNVAGDLTTGPVVYDWTDACLTHPYLDAAHLAGELEDPEAAEAVWEAWTGPWREAHPGVDHARARFLAVAVEIAFQVVTFERIFRAQQPDSRGDLLPAVPWLHDRLVAAHAAGD